MTTSPNQHTLLDNADHASTAAADPGRRLRMVLRLNAITSAGFGVVGLSAASHWSTVLGIDNVALTAAVAAGLVVFATGVAWVSTLDDEGLVSATPSITLGDLSWVVATLVVLVGGWLTTTGAIAAAIVAMGVADFAIGQWWLRRRLLAVD